MDYDSALKFLFSFYQPARPTRPAWKETMSFILAHKLEAVCEAPVIQITGTNGKGSTAALSETMLRNTTRTLTLTSPHLYSIRERIRIDGNPISKSLFADLLGELRPYLESTRETNFAPRPFDIVIFLALYLHQNVQREQIGIFEVDIGGANDPTNVFENSAVGLTRVSEDHLELFGGSLTGIVDEKIGLCRAGASLYSQTQDPEIAQYITGVAQKRGIKLNFVHEHPTTTEDIGVDSAIHTENYALARYLAKHHVALDPESIESAHSLQLPWRFEKRSVSNKKLVLDGAHNFASVDLLLKRLLEDGPTSASAIFSISQVKQYRKICTLIINADLFSQIYLVQPTRGQMVPPEVLKGFLGDQALVFSSMKEALEKGLADPANVLVIFGSFKLAYDIEYWLNKIAPQAAKVAQGDLDPRQSWMRPLK